MFDIERDHLIAQLRMGFQEKGLNSWTERDLEHLANLMVGRDAAHQATSQDKKQALDFAENLIEYPTDMRSYDVVSELL